MDQTRTPPPGSDLMPHGAHESQQHSVAVIPTQEYSEYAVGRQSNPGGEMLLPSPGPQNRGNVYPYDSQHNPYAYQPSYPTTTPGSRYNTMSPEPATFGGMYDDHQLFPSQYATPIDSRATTPSSAYASATMQTWSSPEFNKSTRSQQQAPQGTASNTRYVRGKNKKKKKKDSADSEPKFAPLEKPLSELTKDWDHVPVADIEAYVNRSAEVRRKEVADGKIPGKVKRPMNSFMLYRKAYQNRCKKWCLQQNHQVVSQVCGDSWPLESKEVRDQFNEWSRIERLNHQNAHPGYKFSPSKAGAAKAAAKRKAEGNQADESDLEDFDWEGLDQRPRKQLKPTPRKPVKSSYDYYREMSEEPSYHGHSASPYQGNSPGDMLGDTPNYLQAAHPNYFNPGPAEGSMYRQPNVPVMNPPGHPGGHLYSELDQYQLPDGFPTADLRIDPSLTAQGVETYSGGYGGQQHAYQGADVPNELPWDGSYGLANDETVADQQSLVGGHSNLDQLQLHEQNTQILKGEAESWSVEPLHDVRQEELDKWMDEV